MSPWSHLEEEWRIDLLRNGYTAAAERSTLIRLDPRGHGLSDPDPPDFGLDSMVLDIEAVVDAIGIDDLRILAIGFTNIPALAYAARHQDKVTHLIQTPPMVNGADMTSERLEALKVLGKVDFALTVETVQRAFNPNVPFEITQQFAALARASLDVERFERLTESAATWNAEAEAASLVIPTLLLHDKSNPDMDLAVTRRTAGLIKNSQVAFASPFGALTPSSLQT
jgi:pimeloyl-ACP methyl ester carboxylesterase